MFVVKVFHDLKDFPQPTLTNLNLFCCNDLDESTFDILIKRAGENILNMNVFRCKITVLNSIEFCKKLEGIVLSRNLSCLFISQLGCDKVTDADLLSIAQNCPKLQRIFLHSVLKITDEGICQLAKSCTELESVSLPLQIGDAAISNTCYLCNHLVELSRNCKNIKNIDLTDNKAITSRGVTEILMHCSQLYSLALPDCTNIHDDAFSILNENSNDLDNGNNSPRHSQRNSKSEFDEYCNFRPYS